MFMLLQHSSAPRSFSASPRLRLSVSQNVPECPRISRCFADLAKRTHARSVAPVFNPRARTFAFSTGSKPVPRKGACTVRHCSTMFRNVQRREKAQNEPTEEPARRYSWCGQWFGRARTRGRIRKATPCSVDPVVVIVVRLKRLHWDRSGFFVRLGAVEDQQERARVVFQGVTSRRRQLQARDGSTVAKLLVDRDQAGALELAGVGAQVAVRQLRDVAEAHELLPRGPRQCREDPQPAG